MGFFCTCFTNTRHRQRRCGNEQRGSSSYTDNRHQADHHSSRFQVRPGCPGADRALDGARGGTRPGRGGGGSGGERGQHGGTQHRHRQLQRRAEQPAGSGQRQRGPYGQHGAGDAGDRFLHARLRKHGRQRGDPGVHGEDQDQFQRPGCRHPDRCGHRLQQHVRLRHCPGRPGERPLTGRHDHRPLRRERDHRQLGHRRLGHLQGAKRRRDTFGHGGHRREHGGRDGQRT